jgi:hypothetical protein
LTVAAIISFWKERQCSRLITNAIIYYNTALLPKVYEQKRSAGDEKAIEVLRGVSLVELSSAAKLKIARFTRWGGRIDHLPFLSIR